MRFPFRRAAPTLAVAALAALLLLGSRPLPPTEALAAAVASALAAAWTWVLGRALFPSGTSAGLLLVAGGLVVLSALTLAMLLRTAFGGEPAPAPDAPRPRSMETALRLAPRPAAAPVGYRGPRDEEFRRGRQAGGRIDASSVDELLDYLVQAEVGEPRVLRSLPSLMKLRLHECRGCSPDATEGPTGEGVGGCAFECGLLETSMARVLGGTVVVHEVACRGRGASACDFEVWY